MDDPNSTSEVRALCDQLSADVAEKARTISEKGLRIPRRPSAPLERVATEAKEVVEKVQDFVAYKIARVSRQQESSK